MQINIYRNILDKETLKKNNDKMLKGKMVQGSVTRI